MHGQTLTFCLIWAATIGQILSACSTGYSYQHGTSCYHFSNDAETWINSKLFCGVMGGYLAKVETLQEAQFLQHQISSFHNTTGIDIWYWIGMTDEAEENIWRWLDGTLVTVDFWSPGEPNSFQGNPENCCIVGADGRWYDVSCRTDIAHFICEKMFLITGQVVG